MAHDLDNYFDVVLKLTKEAGEIVRERIWEIKQVETKSCEIDLVTEIDQQVEKMLITSIGSHFPEHKFIGEESTINGIKVVLSDDPTWIIDPIDGTMNFVHGYPNTCISIGFTINKVPEIGIIYNPVLEQLFTARRGKGAFYNGKPIKVSSRKDLPESLVALEFGTSRDPEKIRVMTENVKTLVPLAQGLRSSGSAALTMASVALGGLDCYFDFGLHAWDMAAGYIIIREAGGVVIDPTGGLFDLLSGKVLCASTIELAEKMSSVLHQYTPPRDD